MSVYVTRTLLWSLIRPLKPGKPFLGGWVLRSLVEEDNLARLSFDHEDGEKLRLLLYPVTEDVPHWTATATTKIGFAGQRPTDDGMRLALAVVQLIRRNEETGVRRVWLRRPQLLTPPDENLETDLLISTACQNNCIFCTDRPSRLTYIPTDEVERRMRQVFEDGYRDIEFTSLEPTLRKDLLELIQEANRIGFHKVKIVTNGIKTADRAYTKALFDAGLSKITLSVHSHSAVLENAITQNPKAFDEKTASLRNISELIQERREAGKPAPEFRTNTVIHTRNLAVLPETARFLAGYDPDEMDFYFVYPHGLALTNFDDVVPRLDSMAPYIQRLVDAAHTIPVPIMLLDIPLCVVPGIGGHFRQYRVTHSSIQAKPDTFNKNENKWDEERQKGPQCADCDLNHACDGVWWFYAHQRGTDELKPVKLNDDPLD